MSQKFVSLNNLIQYHDHLMKMLGTGKLVPINICPNCGGIIDSNNECKYCGAKLKLVIDKGDE